jgi:putative component of membrane protein insertase Oxa1/YidC/SpoIIIJ protein YidD
MVSLNQKFERNNYMQKYLNKIKTIFSLIIFLSSILFAQTDYHRWEAKDISYEIQTETADSINNSSSIIGGLKFIYSFFISDLDGDNCPFNPSCSHFFVEAVHETNIFTGALMFADRFTRDTNLYKSLSQYSFHKSGKLNDPVYKYVLDENIIVEKALQKYSAR